MERSETSSDQGRCWERPERTVSVMWLMNGRKSGAAAGEWDSPVEMVFGFVMGRIAGDEGDIYGSGEDIWPRFTGIEDKDGEFDD